MMEVVNWNHYLMMKNYFSNENLHTVSAVVGLQCEISCCGVKPRFKKLTQCTCSLNDIHEIIQIDGADDNVVA